ncbi:DNA cytosine methyltransferase [Ralstonia pseudosolanacearum]|uniref:DNA cytosine methyltransferase n=1 Tax=Ralstonia pseudosolanacearum TaxID=1310165 RepID=UPI003CEC9BE0
MKRDQFDFRAFAAGFRPEFKLDLVGKLIVDLFAGGGGMSTAIEWALGRSPHIAINHSADALSMHAANHPNTEHYIADVFEVCPKTVTKGQPVGLLHLSPDCTHHSQAAGGQPRSAKIRGLSWVGYRWAAQVRPDILTLENVSQILKWCPLIAKRDKATGRVIKIDKTVAAPGERVPVQEQFLIPDPKRVGETWRKFVRALESLGYVVETRMGCAADYGAPTTRERLFMVARCDGKPIVWPEPTHFKDPKPGQMKWRAAAETIDFSIECPSIFEREKRGKKPLAKNTLRRLAKGTQCFVIDSAEPFIIPLTHHGSDRMHAIGKPLPTITCANRGELSFVKPTLVPIGQRKSGGLKYRRIVSPSLKGEGGRSESRPSSQLAAGMLVKFRFNGTGLSLAKPLPVITAGGNGKGRPAGAAHALGLSTMFLAQMNGGFNDERGTPGHDVRRPMSSITNTGSQQQLVKHELVRAEQAGSEPLAAHMLTMRNGSIGRGVDEPVATVTAGSEHHALVAAHLTHLRGNCDARPLDEPVRTISAGGQHHGVVEAHLINSAESSAPIMLSPENEAKALRVARFMLEYADLNISPEEAARMTKEELLALVTVYVHGVAHVIVDISLRMLASKELYKAQGFPSSYLYEKGHDGRVFTKEKQVRMCGNSVSPYHGAAIIAANCPHLRNFSAADLKRLQELEAA